MLISQPFLAREQGTGSRASDTDQAHQGLYPVTSWGGWHGGVHLVARLHPCPVRAIADGTVIAYRAPTQKPEGQALLDHPLNYGGQWTDDGFVLMKHEKECGEGRKVVFYSLYMHLEKITHKDLGGDAGQIQTDPMDKKMKRRETSAARPSPGSRKASMAAPPLLMTGSRRPAEFLGWSGMYPRMTESGRNAPSSEEMICAGY